MRNSYFNIAASFLIAAACLAGGLAPARAQALGTAVVVRTIPNDLYFWVDGVRYSDNYAAVWPTGSQHTLYIEVTAQNSIQFKTLFSFVGWSNNKGTLMTGNPVIVTADPAISEYDATFTTSYAVSLSFYSCTTTPCSSPGTIFVNGTGYSSDTDIYMPAGSAATLTGVANPGWVFSGFRPGPNQTIVGYTDNVVLNGPAYVSPIFQTTNAVTLNTVPAGLQVVADGAVQTTPITEQWGLGTTHTLAALPQRDSSNNWWVFGSWSDGGASLHTFSPNAVVPTSITCTYVPGSGVTLVTSPPSLSLSVDGRSDWPNYSFVWPVGETHQLSAPAQQVDAQGNAWGFVSWSDGGAASHSFTAPAGGVRLTATYAPMAHLTVNSSLSSLAVAVDGNSCPTPCDVIRPVGANVRVSAPASVPVNASSRQDFSGWPGGSGTDWVSTLSATPTTITANYHLMNLLTTSSSPANSASWTLQPVSPDGFYDASSTVSVSVAGQPGFNFSNWTGDLSGTNPQASVGMSAPRSIQAVFTKVPYISPAGISNAAGATPVAGVAPGSIVAIFGANLTPGTATGPASPMVQTLVGVTVTSGGSLLPLYYISPTQISVQLPPAFPLGAATLTVAAAGQQPVSGSFNVVQDAPGLFQQSVAGQNYGSVTHADGTLVTPASPAQQGESLTLYGTGFGPTSTPRLYGFAIPLSPAFSFTDPLSLQVGPAVITPDAAYALPGSVGVDVVVFHLTPDVPAASNANVYVTVNGQASNIVVLPVQ